MADLSKLSLDDLQAQFVSLGDQLSTLAESRRAILVEMQSRSNASEVLAKIADMNEADKLTLVNALAEQGIAATAIAQPVSPTGVLSP